jgi:hypothetical protein
VTDGRMSEKKFAFSFRETAQFGPKSRKRLAGGNPARFAMREWHSRCM